MLDQLLIVCSQKGQLTRIDYAENAVDHFQSNLADSWQFCALNTNVPHVLAESEYGDRVKELELIIQLLRKASSVSTLGSPTLSLKTLNGLLAKLEVASSGSDFDTVDDGLNWSEAECQKAIDDLLSNYKIPSLLRHQNLTSKESLAVLLKRIRHQKTSSLIVVAAGEAAAKGDAHQFGNLLTKEGRSLRMSGDFQITGDNGAQDALLDFGFEEAQKLGLKVFGRMLGGGGGGNVLFMVDRTNEQTYQTWISQTQVQYAQWAKKLEGEVQATLIEPVMSDGAALIY
jgi:galactokinase